jgi:hypothetical protein
MFVGMYISDFYLRCSVKYSNSAWLASAKSLNPPPPPLPKKSIDAITLAKKPAIVTRQLTKSIEFRQNYACDSHLCPLYMYSSLSLYHV